ncbi:LEM domain-containing protein 1 isoform X2 [Hemicordylus capensis]|nr:LEM domain-containing protein 1 isoform X2 [Hemicordylus capensis]XP_053106739.1 LEM domain-containing protein 1 isoform X2 [Hemicordylus capensis]
MEKVTVDVLLKSGAQDTIKEDSAEQDSQNKSGIRALNDTELREQLCAYGISPGPILPSTRTVYEKKLLQLMKQCPSVAAEKSGVRAGDSENEMDGRKEKTAEVVVETNNLKVTAECTSGLDNQSHVDVAERQKKLLSSDAKYSLAKIVAELQEILPDGKVAAHQSQGQRRKVGSSPERSYRQKTVEIPCGDYSDANVSTGQSSRRRVVNVTPSVKQRPEIKCRVTTEKPKEGLIPMRVKIALFAIFLFIVFVYVTMETNLNNPFTSFISG